MITARKGQTGIEYLVIVGVLLFALSIIFVSISINYSESTKSEEASDAVRILVSAANRIHALGIGTKTFVYITLPEGLASTNISSNEITIKIKTFSGTSDIVGATVPQLNGSLPSDPGIYKIYLLVQDNGVVLIGTNITQSIIGDYNLPVVNLVPPTPANGSTVTDRFITFKAEVTDETDITACTLYIGGIPYGMIINALANPVQCTLLKKDIPDGWHEIKVGAVDSAANEGFSETRWINISVRIKVVTSAMLTYFVSGGSNVPRYRSWNMTAWSPEQGALDPGIPASSWQVLESNPTKTEYALFTKQRSDEKKPDLYAQMRSGSAWQNLLQVSTYNGDKDAYGTYDVAYEQKSGRLMTVYADYNDYNQTLKYITFSNGAWSSEAPVYSGGDSAAKAKSVMRLAAKPNADELIAVVSSKSGNLAAYVWRGSYTCIKEICNGVDDDCDGLVDEELVTNCSLQSGVCAGATQTCTNGQWSSCNYGSNYEPIETRCDIYDNDCDGQINETCNASVPPLNTCMGSPSACSNFNNNPQACIAANCTWDPLMPLPLKCAGTPMACSGHPNNWTCLITGCTWVKCTDNDSDGFSSVAGEVGCQHAELDCNDTMASVHTNGTELCDTIDNDCNGVTNDNLDLNCPLQLGVCAGAVHTCMQSLDAFYKVTSAVWAACNYGANYETSETQCDSLDNDCDGSVDEGCPQQLNKWSKGFNLSNKLATYDTLSFDVTYEQNSGNALVTWQEGDVLFPKYRVWNGYNWGPEKNGSVLVGSAPGLWYELSEKKNSDGLMLAVYAMDNIITTQFWNGTSWYGTWPISNNAYSNNNRRNFAAAYEQKSSGKAVIVYSENPGGPVGPPSLKYNYWNGTKWLGPYTISGVNNPSEWVVADADIYSNEILFAHIDSVKNVYATFWDPVNKNFGTPFPAQSSGVNTQLSFAVCYDKS